jgi:uncharacterized membrane protein YkvA (DUF1232 family)
MYHESEENIMRNENKNSETDPFIADAVEKKKSKAEEYLRDPEKAKQLISDAVNKARSKEKNKGPLNDIWNYLTALFRLLRSYVTREYTAIPWASIVLVAVAIIYFVAIVDIIPDFIPGVGFIDDAAVIAFVISQIRSDLDKYMQWETEQKSKE